jgi:dienelactone hydrolase
MRWVTAAVAAALALTALGGEARARVEGPKADDVRLLAQRLVREHPNPFHDLARTTFDAAVSDVAARADALDDDRLLVELMRLAALPGVRDGHTGIFPTDPANRRPLHLYPIRGYAFADGTFVVAQAGGRDLVGARLLAIAGVPLDRVEDAVRPLVPRDNDSTLRARLPTFFVTAEVLHGLGMTPSVGPLGFTFERNGVRFERTLAPIALADYYAAIDPNYALNPQGVARVPTYLARRGQGLWKTKLSSGRVLYLGYNVTLGGTAAAATWLRKAAKSKAVRAIVVDVRLNGGGDNNTYFPLLQELTRLSKSKRIVVVIGRATFSAAENFVTDLERQAHPVFVGELSGGSPNLYGDTANGVLPASGLDLRIATIYWQKSTANDSRIGTAPDVPVDLTSSDFFAGRDPVLDAALRTALSPRRVRAGDPSFFAYDVNRPLALELGSAQSGGAVVRQELTFDAGRGPVHGYWTHPPGDGPWPVVLFSPGFGGDDTDQLPEANRLVSKGIASLTVTPPAGLITCNAKADVQAYRDYVVGRRRAIDVLSQLHGADTSRVAAVGFSFGAAVTATLVGVDHRLRAAVVQSGRAHLSTATSVACTQLGRARLAVWKKAVSAVDPVRWVGTSRPAALLFQNGTRDPISPRADVNAFVRAAGKPKELRWYKAAHPLNAAAFAYRDNWLAKRLR